jgi:hypothetical protein
MRAWWEEDATDDPEEIRRAEEELAEFKQAMNETRAAAGARLLYPLAWRGEAMASEAPPSWRQDLQAAVPWIDPVSAVWLGNLNAKYPWRTAVGDVRLADGRRVVLKYQTDTQRMEHERAAARFLEDATAPRIAPECLGADAARRVLLFERLSGPTLAEALDEEGARATWREAARMVASLHHWATDRTPRWLELCPQDGAADRLPAYALPLEALVASFHRAGEEE